MIGPHRYGEGRNQDRDALRTGLSRQDRTAELRLIFMNEAHGRCGVWKLSDGRRQLGQ